MNQPVLHHRHHHHHPVDDSILDKRAVAVGLIVCVLVALGGMYWKMRTNDGAPKRKPEDFQFTVAEPKREELALRDPVQNIVKERMEEMKEEKVEERPNIQISTNPVQVDNPVEVVKSRNLDIETPRIDPSADTANLPDSPVEISQVSPDTVNALNIIAVQVPTGAEIFKYKEPTPSDRPQTAFVNAAPVAGKRVSVLPQVFGDQDAQTVGQLGPMDINLFGSGDSFRNIDRAGALRARSAVDAALHWLAVHQEPSGEWPSEKYDGEVQGTLAMTGLACLAFMGAGNTTRRGEYRRNVIRGLEFILKHQKEGRFLKHGENLYTHAICTIAVAEAYGRAHDDTLHSPAQQAVDYCVRAVLKDGGWRYAPFTGNSDVSVTAWFMQALKTAKLAGLKFDPALFANAQLYLDSLTDAGAGRDSSGIVGYEFKPDQRYDLGSSHSGGKPALTAAGIVIRRFTGMGAEARILLKGADAIRKHAPDWKKKDFYYWYYATYAMHNMGGEHRLWWNRRIRDTLLEHQIRHGEHAGSWDPKEDNWAKTGGRPYTTALGALCLEVYYRYADSLNAFGVAQDIDDLLLQGL